MKKLLSFLIALILLLSMSVTASAETTIPEDAYGVIWIPCLNVRMPVYTSPVNDHEHRQAVIDDDQSALISNWGTAYEILDHAHSEDPNGNQWAIQKIFSGAYAWLFTHDSTYYLECYMTGKTDYIEGSEYLCGRLVTPCSSYDIMVCCCAEDIHHHFIAVFRRLSEY